MIQNGVQLYKYNKGVGNAGMIQVNQGFKQTIYTKLVERKRQIFTASAMPKLSKKMIRCSYLESVRPDTHHPSLSEFDLH
jgi:hypothetical protein